MICRGAREPRDPYLVLVSEIMLQQTQVDRVAPRFVEFIVRFPTIADLAAATEDEVLAAWSGLGYYRRARNLHRLAREVVAGACRGRPPTSSDCRESVPTPRLQISSLAFGEATPVLDGNVMRVGARVLAMETDPRSAAGRRRLEAWILAMMVDVPPGRVNEALMELGAVVCRPANPGCESCPLADRCSAKAEGRPEAYPPPRRRRAAVALLWVAACAIDCNGDWLLRRIDDSPILRGLWLPPLAELEDGADPVVEARRLVSRCETSFRGCGPARAPPHHPSEDRCCPGMVRG